MGAILAVRARGITKCFGDVVALDSIDLDVAHGQIHGLVGPNGAGKTTLLGLLLGLAVADSGRLEILGTPVGRAHAAPDGVAGFVDGPGLYPSLTARQNLAALAALRGGDARTVGIDDVLDQVGLTDVADDRANGFSLGMRQRLGLAAALLTKPRLLGPLSKLAAENRELDYRLLTSDPRTARQLAFETAGIRVVDDAGARRDADLLVVRALTPALDDLVVRLVHAGIAMRELAPVVSPLEAAFLALTEEQTEQQTERQTDQQEAGR